MLELAGPDGTPQRHEVGSGERSPTGHTVAALGLGLEEGKAVLAGVQRHLVTAQVDEHCLPAMESAGWRVMAPSPRPGPRGRQILARGGRPVCRAQKRREPWN